MKKTIKFHGFEMKATKAMIIRREWARTVTEVVRPFQNTINRLLSK
jgi:hypothetical protein